MRVPPETSKGNDGRIPAAKKPAKMGGMECPKA